MQLNKKKWNKKIKTKTKWKLHTKTKNKLVFVAKMLSSVGLLILMQI